MPLQATSGAASYDGFGGNGVPVVPNYIEDCFQTWLYNGTGANQTITNGVDLSTKGGLVWIKARAQPSFTSSHAWIDTLRGTGKLIYSNLTGAEQTYANTLTSFNSNGFSLGADSSDGTVNWSGHTYASWTFREQPKFFDVVTWSGDGTGNRSIPHLLGSTPGFIQTKQTNGTESWWNHHRSVTSPNANWWRNYGVLNSVNAFFDWGDDSGLYQAPDANNLYIGSYYNASGKTYVAYLFAHDAGGFGLTGTDNVISCGSFTTDGSGIATVSLGYEPQWVMTKNSSGSSAWRMFDTMRGLTVAGQNDALLQANSSAAEIINSDYCSPTATGFEIAGHSGSATHIYIAIRRGPMKVPTTGTSVFEPATRTGTGATATVTTAISPVDMVWSFNTNNNLGQSTIDFDRLRGALGAIYTGSTAAEFSAPNTLTSFAVQNGYTLGSDSSGYGINYSGSPFVNYSFKRAPSFMDVVCYTGDGTANRQLNHNLTVTPELIIAKRRSAAQDWVVFGSAVGSNKYLILNTTAASDSATIYTSTSTTFGAQANLSYNTSAATYVAYLFATCAGVSKVGSYTGNGSTQTINCGFGAGGARFVLIKATSTTGNWMTFDTARGMTVLTDPFLSLNSTAAETATLGACTTVSTGFAVNEAILTGINTNGVSYIFLSVA